MGFKVPRRKALVEFEEGHDYHGAVVSLYLDLPIGGMFDLQRAREGDPEAAFRMFAEEALDSWNLEDEDGRPVSTSYEGVKTQSTAFIVALMNKWQEAATTAPAPLEQPSSDTGGSVEQLTPTGTQ